MYSDRFNHPTDVKVIPVPGITVIKTWVNFEHYPKVEFFSVLLKQLRVSAVFLASNQNN
jgi:hypothetical protein